MVNRLGNNQSILGTPDWTAILIYVVLVFMGWLNIYAAVYDETHSSIFDLERRYGTQMIWMGISFFVGVTILLIDDKYYHVLAYPLYWLAIAVLVAVLIFGKEVNGSKSWLMIGSFGIQPTEFVKFTTSLALARFMSTYDFTSQNLSGYSLKKATGSWKKLLAPALYFLLLCVVFGVIVFFFLPSSFLFLVPVFALIVVQLFRQSYFMRILLLFMLPAVLIFLQNDTGSALVYFSFFFMLYREGFNGWFYVVVGMAIAMFVASFLLTPVTLLVLVLLICLICEGISNGRWRTKIIYLSGVTLGSILIYFILNLVFTREISLYVCILLSVVLSQVFVVIYAYREKLRNVYYFIVLFFGSLFFSLTVDFVFDNFLKEHQRKRILDLLGLESDLKGWGYNVNQSKIAIGSGGFTGKGFLNGTQTKYNFVPEQSTDFIFCTVGEEWGFVGSVLVIALFCVLILRLMRMGERQQEPFGRIYCYCVASIFLFHVLINIGMTIGIMPVIGIPLPFFSYGGSSMIAFTILFFVAVKMDASKRETNYFI